MRALSDLVLEVLRLARSEGSLDGDRLSDLSAGLRGRLSQVLEQHVGSLEAERAWRQETLAVLEAENAWRRETLERLEAENQWRRQSLERLEGENEWIRAHEAELSAALSQASAAHAALADHHRGFALWVSRELEALAASRVFRFRALRRRLAELAAVLRAEGR